MNRARYHGYLSARAAIAAQPLDPHAAEVLDDLAEGLLLARDTSEAKAACAAVPEALAELIDGHLMTRRTADRFCVHLKACGPQQMTWPASWDRAPARPVARLGL